MIFLHNSHARLTSALAIQQIQAFSDCLVAFEQGSIALRAAFWHNFALV
jgi:hypothetical protein